MCGIVGLHGPQEPQWIDAMRESVTHRGPDDAGVWRDERIQLSLATRRLAILDIDGGAQPMVSADGRYVIVFNGEIFNAPELRDELERRGTRFTSDHSDTEVVLQLYAADGEASVGRLNGMFAFAIYDRQRRRLFCARDRFGIKPLYYTTARGRFAFASELKALLAAPLITRELHRESLFHYFSLMYVPGTNSIFRDVRRLRAGHSLTYDVDTQRLDVCRWWRPRLGGAVERSRDAWRERIRSALAAAVQRWSLSDVPVACSLSGGLDSSSIVALLASAGAPVRTYSLGFTGPGEERWNELPLARMVAQQWGTTHHELVLAPETLLADLLPMIWHLDEPYAGGLPSWAVFKHMSRDVKVGFTGTGGDELFGNYGKWRSLEGGLVQRVLRRPTPNAAFGKPFFDRMYYWPDADKRRFLNTKDSIDPSAILPAPETRSFLYTYLEEAREAKAMTARDGVAYVDIATQLPEEFLMMTDRFSMAHSLEARTPFLDHELAELVLSIPGDVRTSRGDLKGLLREAVANLLPRPLLRAPKRGFVIPLALWLRGPLRSLVEQLLHPDRLRKQGLIRPEFYEAFVRPHLVGRSDETNKVWAAIMFQLWHHVFVESDSAVKPAYDWKAITQ